MGWRFGIPDFIGNYTYFKSLGETSQNIEIAARRKETLLGMAQNATKNAVKHITDLSNIHAANEFIASVAKSERGKELAVIQAFCKETGQTFPALQPYLNNPASIYNDPDGFYTNLTAALNVARKGTQDYLTELQKIQARILDKSRTLEDYKADDYRYRLNGDISSFLNRLRGRYNNIKDEDAYSLKVQNIVIDIMNELDISSKVSSGEDFAAIAASTLIEIEQQVQARVDEELQKGVYDKDIAHISDDILKEIKQRYLNQMTKSKEAQSPVQRALMDLQGIDFKRVTDNAKTILGLKTVDLDNNALKKHIDNLNARDKYNANKNSMIKHIRDSVATNSQLRKNLSLIDFHISGTKDSKHGSINELIQGLFGSKVRGNVATDIITYKISWQFQRNTDALDELITNIGNEFSSVLQSPELDKPANLRDIRNTLRDMNKEVSRLIKEAEEQMYKMKMFQNKDIFVFHESLKLYSSAETGRGGRKGFEGRNINIMTYIDELQSMSSYGNPIDNISRDDLTFLARNLIPGAVAENQKEPLEQYFSMYAGMVMFDDLANMATEAIEEVNIKGDIIGGKIRQIHLYNLNGIYVPASMILSYVSDAVRGASKFVENGIAAKATITVPTVNENWEKWKSRKWIRNEKTDVTPDGPQLRPEHWQAVAAEAASGTKVKITFLAAFKNFISRLGGL